MRSTTRCHHHWLGGRYQCQLNDGHRGRCSYKASGYALRWNPKDATTIAVGEGFRELIAAHHGYCNECGALLFRGETVA